LQPDNFLSANQLLQIRASRYTPVDFIALVEKHGIRYHEKLSTAILRWFPRGKLSRCWSESAATLGWKSW